MNSFKLEYDKDYGIDKRTGWSVCTNGSYVAVLEGWLIVAIIKSIYWWIKMERHRS
jgi:hypothetical protein